MLQNLNICDLQNHTLSGHWFFEQGQNSIDGMSVAEHRKALGNEVVQTVKLHRIKEDNAFSVKDSSDGEHERVSNFMIISSKKIVSDATNKVAGAYHSLEFQGERGVQFFGHLHAFSKETTEFSEHMKGQLGAFFQFDGGLKDFEITDIDVDGSMKAALCFPERIPDFDVVVMHKTTGHHYRVQDSVDGMRVAVQAACVLTESKNEAGETFVSVESRVPVQAILPDAKTNHIKSVGETVKQGLIDLQAAKHPR